MLVGEIVLPSRCPLPDFSQKLAIGSWSRDHISRLRVSEKSKESQVFARGTSVATRQILESRFQELALRHSYKKTKRRGRLD